MAIITISRGSYSRGKEVAEALAAKLDYECVSRDILLETCQEFSIPEIRLVKALHDAPSAAKNSLYLKYAWSKLSMMHHRSLTVSITAGNVT